METKQQRKYVMSSEQIRYSSLNKLKEEFLIVFNEMDLQIKKFEEWIDEVSKKYAETKEFGDSLIEKNAYRNSLITIETSKADNRCDYTELIYRFMNENPIHD
jgi:hypothetical protein